MAKRRSPSWVRLALWESAIAIVGIAVVLILGSLLDGSVLTVAAESSRF
jgi:hypothetical protein